MRVDTTESVEKRNEPMYKLMESNSGYSLAHTKGLTKQEADTMRDEHAETFPDNDWWVQQHDKDDEKACDGWEDIYSHD